MAKKGLFTKKGFFFFSDAWLGDSVLKMLGSDVQATWIYMLAHMATTNPPGYMVMPDGSPCSNENIAVLTGKDAHLVNQVVHQLIIHKVCSVTHEGVIYSRKMVKLHELSEKRATTLRSPSEKESVRGERTTNTVLVNQLVHQNANQLVHPQSLSHINKSNIKGNKTHPYNPLSGDECVSLESLHPTEITPGMRRWYSPSPEDNQARAIRLFNDCLEGTKEDPENRAFRAENANRLKFVEAIKAALDDFTWEQLEAAIQSYTLQCDRAKIESKYRKTPNKFFEEGLYRQFIDAQEVSNVASS